MSIFSRVVALTLAATTFAIPASAAGSPRHNSELERARTATAKYHSIATAEQAGYGLFPDAAKIACIDEPGMGGMGVHYVNSSLVGDAILSIKTPEAVVYAPTHDGTLRLAALEYIVFQSAWTKHQPPALFGHTFTLTTSPNRFGIPAFYSLHVWVWKHNPAGTFAMWNPKVHCP